MPSIAASFLAVKKVFRDVLLDLIGINFRIAEFLLILVIPAMFFTSVTCRLSNIRKPPSAAEPLPEHQLRSCKRKQTLIAEFRSTIRVAWSSLVKFLTSVTCHLFEKRWRESMITVVAVSRGACYHRLHFAISRKIHNFARSFCHLSCVAASRMSHFALYQHPPPDGPARRTSRWHLQP